MGEEEARGRGERRREGGVGRVRSRRRGGEKEGDKIGRKIKFVN